MVNDTFKTLERLQVLQGHAGSLEHQFLFLAGLIDPDLVEERNDRDDDDKEEKEEDDDFDMEVLRWRDAIHGSSRGGPTGGSE